MGAHSYTLIHNYTGPIPSNCKNNCTYERNDQDGSRYCFAVGENQVQCQPDLMDFSYPDVDLKNNYISSVKGEVKYSSIFCENDHYTLSVGDTFTNSRGVCLITHVTGHDVNTGAECTQYSSSGTSYSKFVITSALSGSGCTITRLVN